MAVSITEPRATDSTDSEERHLEALVEVFECISLHGDLQDLLHEIASRLRPLVAFDVIYVSLYDALHNVMRVSVVEASIPVTLPVHLQVPLDESAAGFSWKTQQPLFVNDMRNESRFPEVARIMYESNVRRLCVLPLTTVHRKLGAIAFGRVQEVEYAEAEFRLLEKATAEIALAVDNSLHHQEVVRYEKQLRDERDRTRQLLDFTNTLVNNLGLEELFSAISAGLRKIIHHDYASLVFPAPGTNELTIYAVDFPHGKGLVRANLSFNKKGSLAERVFATGMPVFTHLLQVEDFPAEPTHLLLAEGLKSACCLPLINRERSVGALTLASVRPAAFTAADAELLVQIANQVAIALDNALAFREIAELKDRLTEEKLYLQDEIRTEFNFDEIIGENREIKALLKQVETVGPTDAPVLILGETGTGKELVARAIHRVSRRQDRAFVKINCAAIPTGLLESELFGHEKGAFTGAIARKVGRLELAHHGTIFLDEIGDISPDLQPKLLRVLQESEFERLGSNTTIHVDVRLIAATNRNLAQMVADNQFRSDLYYRLRVFPILVPPLRERKDDIPLLVRFFTQKYSRRMAKPIKKIPPDGMQALVNWRWPGNIREMENFIERCLILSPGPELNVPVDELKEPGDVTPVAGATLESAERECILGALRDTGGLISGANGAAAKLGLKRTTLQAKMKKLGITRSQIGSEPHPKP
ncbi:MAG: sigma 54-interacting transcriptional regulator [Acidobacteriia bacterium]|nr:sigma 54-interacting transcriptional regulator [Terriglobia bacterium]